MSASLAALQQRFIAALLDGHALPDAVAPSDAVAFYVRNVHANLRNALAAAYPVTQRLVGEAFFGEACRVYVGQFPSTSGDLHRFGGAFASFLEAYPPARGLGYLPDVARLEWAVHESGHAADAPPFDFAGLAKVPHAQHGSLRLRVAPHVRLLATSYPVVAIWEANQPGRDGVPTEAAAADRVLVHRSGLEVIVERLDEPSWRFFTALASGAALERASESLGAEEGRMPAMLAHWTARGVITGFELCPAA